MILEFVDRSAGLIPHIDVLMDGQPVGHIGKQHAEAATYIYVPIDRPNLGFSVPLSADLERSKVSLDRYLAFQSAQPCD